jgi:hypothetical protein
VKSNDAFRLITPEQADRIVFWGMLAFAAVGYAWGGY